MKEDLGSALSGVLSLDCLPEVQVSSVGFYSAEFPKGEQIASDSGNGLESCKKEMMSVGQEGAVRPEPSRSLCEGKRGGRTKEEPMFNTRGS